jgi:hypothetical protein
MAVLYALEHTMIDTVEIRELSILDALSGRIMSRFGYAAVIHLIRTPSEWTKLILSVHVKMLLLI